MKEKGSGNFVIRYWKYLLILILFMLAVYALLYLTYENLKREMIANLHVKQMILAKQAARGIETFFNEHLADLQCLAKNKHLIDLDETGKRMMREYHWQYPEYYFHQHKGYGTALHLKSLKKHGVCRIHRLSYAPVRKINNNDQ